MDEQRFPQTAYRRMNHSSLLDPCESKSETLSKLMATAGRRKTCYVLL
jgi:hypothetical protein